MDIGITSYKDLAELLSYIITSLSLIGIVITYVWSKKQIHFSTMDKCLNNYRQIIMSSMIPADNKAEEYIDFVNEEFFYMENGYLPLEVSIEWIDGMIDYLPFIRNQEFIKSNRLQGLQDDNRIKQILHDFPRVRKAIQLNVTIDFNNVHLSIETEENISIRKSERDKIIVQIISNLKLPFWKKLFLRKKVANR